MAKKKLTPFEYIVKNHTVEDSPAFTIKKFLSPTEQYLFVKSVVENVVENGVYYPAFLDYAIRHATMVHYTDIAMPDEDYEENINKLAYDTDLYDYVLENIHSKQYEALIAAVQEQIKYDFSDPASRLVHWINVICSSLNSKLAGLNFSEEDVKAVTALAHNINNISEEQLVNAITKINKN